MNFKRTAYLSLALTIIVLFLLAQHPWWSGHLHTDVDVYFQRVDYFLQNGSFENLIGNEYQPGALIFFLAISPILWLQKSITTYQLGLFIVNVWLIIVLAILYKSYGNFKNVILLSLILLLTGPIVLFRFDLYVMTIVIFSIYLWKKNFQTLAIVFLCYASFVKIFPVIFLPYYLIIAYKNRGLKQTVKILQVYLVSYFVYLGIFSVATGMKPSQIMASFGFIANTPVHTESLWGTLTTLIWMVTTGEFAKGAGSWGIFGIASEFQIGPLWFYNYFWIIPIGLFYLWIFYKMKKNEAKFDVSVCLLVALLFLLFSKILHHQYTLWFMLLIPLLDVKLLLIQARWVIFLFLTLLASILHQYVYPLHYTEWIFNFYTTGSYSYLFWLIALRNGIFIFLAVILLVELRNLRHARAA